MFRLPSPDETFPTRCTIHAPEGEKTVEREIVAHFRAISMKRFRELAAEGDEALFAEILDDWEGVHDAAGEPVVCDAAGIRIAAEAAWFAAGLVKGWLDRFGPEKNFRPPLNG